MKLYIVLFSLICMSPAVAMQGSKKRSAQEAKIYWESGRFPSGEIKWIKYEGKNMIVIREKPNISASTGRKYDENSAVTELTYQQVMHYLREIHPERFAPKINMRDL